VIQIKRAELPGELNNRLTALTENIASVERGQRAVEARRKWKGQREVRKRLSEVLRTMAAGRERCMYCGDNQGTDIDHFEPITRNPLRTFEWLNHLLACALCNSHKKRNRFPADVNGRPLLIDPTADDPADHLLLTLSFGRYVALTDKGRVTIEVCDLNRPLLQRGRVNSRTNVESSLLRWAVASHDGDTGAMEKLIFTVREQPCADVCQAMLRQAAGPNADIIFSDTPKLLTILRSPEIRAALLN
jgi:hypothetical protein